LLKLEPFSRKAGGALKLDAQGPFATLAVGDMKPQKTCTLQLGQTYQDYLGNCIQPWDPGGANKGLNDVDLNKIKGGRTHDYENIAWSVAGANEYFTQPT